ncbi:hypothetical protein SAMN04487770_104156 [Butyrivibrio sp. ob235]|uniref:DUF5688 family protein n=1 Tax=Butyrivibrio sp. ob235 TaxID=1761780 RepID=UPI0008AE768A|nr:DUF5688 family protein [Butyrivibrio sp. ob235]SEK95927.1 hypothetical protein SAMN04487770_104156 [Butyrivibrio sp. ob235]
MDFETFKENLAKDVKETLELRTGSDFSVENHTVDKMNETYEALTVKPEDSIIGVNLNATALYKELDSGKTYDDIVSGAADVAENALEHKMAFDLETFKDYDTMKGTLAMEVVSAEKNAEILETVPHKDMEDMAVVYRFVLGDTDQGSGTILVTNQMLDNYGVTPEQLHEDAVKNAPEIRPLVIQGMGEVLAKQMGVEDLEMLGLNIPPEQEQMFVASVEGNVHGAGVLAYQDFMDKASERVNGDFFILPSSIHEVLIIPDNGNFDLKSLENMVKEVNATTVDPADQLTDNVYHYDSKEKIFELGEKFVERQAAREAKEAEAGDKKSLLGELKSAKEQASKQPANKAVEAVTKSKGDASL